MRFPASLIAFGLAGWLTASTLAADDIEVLGRGPVHEAYAEPSEREPKPTPVIPKEPPKSIEELPPDQKPEGDNVQWMPGYWQWDEAKKDYVWVSGFWRNAPPGRAWVPGAWHKAADGWQWTGGFWAAATDNPDGQADVEYLPPPPAPLDNDGPTVPAPSDSDLYVPGTWVWRDHYVWQPGYWTGYEPGRVWVAAHYRWTPAGCVFVDGYWDYPLVDRGVLFAPVSIPPAVCADPGFVFTPSYVVQENCLFGSLFCRQGFGSYFFGDYFSPAFASLGFTPWCGGVGLSIGFGGGGWCDPLFNFYRCAFRSDPFWGGGGIFDLFAGRFRGDFLRPPVNLVQQNTAINNITKNTTINNVNVTNLQMVRSLNEAARSGRHHFQPVSDPARHQFARNGDATRQAATRRAATEGQLAARRGAGPGEARPERASLPVVRGPASRPGAGAGVPNGAPAAAGRPARSPAGTVTPAAPRPAGIGRNQPAPVTPNRMPSAARNPATPRPPVTQRAPAGVRPPVSASNRLPQTARTAPALPRTTPPPSAALPRTNPSLTPRVNPAPRVTPRPSASVRPFSAPAYRPPTPRPSVSAPRAPNRPSVPRSVARPSVPRQSFARPAMPRPSVARPAAPQSSVAHPAAPHPSARPKPAARPGHR